MNKQVKKYLTLLLILLVPGIAIIFFSKGDSTFVALDYFGEYQTIERTVNGKNVVDSIPYQVPHHTFNNHLGDIIDTKDLEGKTLVINFFPEKSHLWQIQQEFKNVEDVVMISFTANEKYSDPEQLKILANKSQAIEGKWHFVLSDRKETLSLAHDYYFSAMLKNDRIEELLDTETALIVDKNRNIRGVYDISFSDEIGRLNDEIKLVIKEHFLRTRRENQTTSNK